MNLQGKNKIEPSKQINSLSCMANCLLTLIKYHKGIEFTPEEEWRIFSESLESPDFYCDFTMNTLVLACRKYRIGAEVFIDTPIYFDFLSNMKLPDNIIVKQKKINRKFIQACLNKSPVILYLDKFYITSNIIDKYRFPHYVVLHKFGKQAKIIDPGDGKEKTISSDLLIKSIKSLRNRLWISPKLIRIVEL